MADWSIRPDERGPSGGQAQPVGGRAGSPFIVGLLILVIAVAIGGYVIDRLSPFQPAALPTTEPTPSPTATVAVPIALFMELMGDPDLSYRRETVAMVDDGVDSAMVTVRADYSGPDAAITVSVQSTLASVRTVTQRTVIKDGVNYLKDGDAAWAIMPGGASVSNPFASMRVDQIDYVGWELHDGAWLNHFRISSDTAGYAMQCRLPDVSVVDLWVRNDGVPVSGSSESPCSPVRGIDGTTSYTYEFSKVGEPIDIEVPAQFR